VRRNVLFPILLADDREPATNVLGRARRFFEIVPVSPMNPSTRREGSGRPGKIEEERP